MKTNSLNKTALPAALAAALILAGCSGSGSKTEDKKAASDKTTFTVGFDSEFPPYGFKDGEDYTGLDLDLAQAVADYYGWELIKQPIDWDSKDMELNSGAIDCIWNGFTINGREDQYTWTAPYIDNSQVIVVKDGSGISSLDDLAGKVIEVQADSSALAALQGEDATDAGKKIAAAASQVVQVPNYNTAFMDLEAGAADAVAMDVGVANYQLSNRKGGFKILDDVISSEQYGIGFKKGNEELKNKVTDALNELDEKGTLDEIIKKWSTKDDGAYSFLETTWCWKK